MSEENVKSDMFDDEKEEEEPLFGPAALGLHRVGTELPKRPKVVQPVQVLNARGMPARIRKKNSKYNDEIVGDVKLPSKVTASPAKKSNPSTPTKQPPPSPAKGSTSTTPKKQLAKRNVSSLYMKSGTKKKDEEDEVDDSDDDDDSDRDESRASTPQPSTSKSTAKQSTSKVLSTNTSTEAMNMLPIDKKACQRIGLRLRNLLKLPKAHKFVMYEFFYSNIDRSLFAGKNDFQKCLQLHFPNLKAQKMSKSEWSEVRRMLGKPRRCSSKFFSEERFELERKRQKIRLLQSKKSGDASFMCDLPADIPLPITIGTKVTARLRNPQDGLFTGTVEGLESPTNSYRILFDRAGIGAQSIPDYEVMSTEAVETISTSKLTKDFKLKGDISCYMVSPLKKAGPLSSITKDPLLGGEAFLKASKSEPILTLPETGVINNVPVPLLEAIVRAKKVLEMKHMQLLKIRRYNTEAEVKKSYGEGFSEEFQKKYASLITGMEKINQNLTDSFNQLQSISEKFIVQPEAVNYLTPSYLREKCRDLADQTFTKNNSNLITDEAMAKLITNLASIMWVTSNLKNDQYPNVIQVLDGAMEEAKTQLDPENKILFQKSVSAHIGHIRVGIMEEGKFGADDDMMETEEIIIDNC